MVLGFFVLVADFYCHIVAIYTILERPHTTHKHLFVYSNHGGHQNHLVKTRKHSTAHRRE